MVCFRATETSLVFSCLKIFQPSRRSFRRQTSMSKAILMADSVGSKQSYPASARRTDAAELRAGSMAERLMDRTMRHTAYSKCATTHDDPTVAALRQLERKLATVTLKAVARHTHRTNALARRDSVTNGDSRLRGRIRQVIDSLSPHHSSRRARTCLTTSCSSKARRSTRPRPALGLSATFFGAMAFELTVLQRPDLVAK